MTCALTYISGRVDTLRSQKNTILDKCPSVCWIKKMFAKKRGEWENGSIALRVKRKKYLNFVLKENLFCE